MRKRQSRSRCAVLKKLNEAYMKLNSTMLVVADMNRSVNFYKTALDLNVIADFGANKTLTGGLALQTLDTYKEFIGSNDVAFGGHNFELYFEEDNFDNFIDRLKGLDIKYVHPVKEHSWGQRVVRFYDPDGNIIEVGENMKNVCMRFAERGMTSEQIAGRMDVPVEYVKQHVE